MNALEIKLASDDAFDVRQFSVNEPMNGMFRVEVVATSTNQSIDFEALIAQPARLTVHWQDGGTARARTWSGVVAGLEQLKAETTGVATYHVTIVPTLWLASQRRNYRMFQQMSELEIALKMLDEWGIKHEEKLDASAYKKRKYKVQYAESDQAFIARMLEEAGIASYFVEKDGASILVLNDAPQGNDPRKARLPFRDHRSSLGSGGAPSAWNVHISRQVQPGRYTMRDHDYRRPADYKLLASAASDAATPVEGKLESFHYVPGAFLFGGGSGGETPVADDKGRTRTDEREGQALAKKRLENKRGEAYLVAFETDALDLAPGVVVGLLDHPHAHVGDGKLLLVTSLTVQGIWSGEFNARCEGRSSTEAYRPPLLTPRPSGVGVESATIVGPAGEEIRTDEFGRVRVHFHWDRESKMDDDSSCWIHVSQSWGGAGFGGVNLPRVGQEVLVDFLGGDPDRPIITGRVYTNLQKVPYKLPESKTQSGWKSNSTGGGGGYNEVMFDDLGGSELFNMQAEKDLQKLVKNDERQKVGRNKHSVVGTNHHESVGATKTTHVGKDLNIKVKGDRDAKITGGDTVHCAYATIAIGDKGNTFITMSEDSITLRNTSGSQITLDGPTVTIHAAATLNLTSETININGSGLVDVLGQPIHLNCR
jgi:type VI secretion system secreted protein VgrG